MLKTVIHLLLLWFIFKLLSKENIKTTLFTILALMPICIAFVFFDIDPLLKIKIVKIFFPKSLVAIGVLFTSVLLSFRIVIAKLLEAYFQNIMVKKERNFSFLNIFYISCYHVILGTLFPFIITYLREGNIVHFFQNVILFNLIYFIIALSGYTFSLKHKTRNTQPNIN